MSPHVVRPAREEDGDALLDLAGKTGGAITNLPHDRAALSSRIARSAASLARDVTTPGDEYYLLVLEDVAAKRVIGTACLYAAIGSDAPFYSYRIGTVRHGSAELDRHFSTEMLHLVNDLEGASEVGGLFLDPAARAAGLGMLLARSRYLFIAQHRARFAARTIAELRGYVDANGSPFWHAVGANFFDMSYLDADDHQARFGTHFVTDLMPRYPLYLSLLPEAARVAVGRPSDDSRAAMALLLAENFRYDGYVHVFDAGPTLTCPTAAIRTIADSRVLPRRQVRAVADERLIAATGESAAFRCWYWQGQDAVEQPDALVRIAPPLTEATGRRAAA